MSLGAEVSAESSTYLPHVDDRDTTTAWHLGLVELARDRLSVPVIASLNGTSPGGWVHYARSLENAGAHAIELNIYDVVVDPHARSSDIEQRYLDLIANSDVRKVFVTRARIISSLRRQLEARDFLEVETPILA